MSTGALVTIICALIGSNALFTFITFMITRRDKKRDALKAIDDRLKNVEETMNCRFESIEKRQKIAEIDQCRTQLLTLMSDYSKDKSEILRLAEHYFVHLKGNWYMTDIFMSWMNSHDVKVPDWFKGE